MGRFPWVIWTFGILGGFIAGVAVSGGLRPPTPPPQEQIKFEGRTLYMSWDVEEGKLSQVVDQDATPTKCFMPMNGMVLVLHESGKTTITSHKDLADGLLRDNRNPVHPAK